MAFSRLAGIVTTGLILCSVNSQAQQIPYSSEEIMSSGERLEVLDYGIKCFTGGFAILAGGWFALYCLNSKKDDNN